MTNKEGENNSLPVGAFRYYGKRLPKVLLVTKHPGSACGGREMLCSLNHDVLSEIYGDKLLVHQLVNGGVRGFRSIIDPFKGYIDGLNRDVFETMLQQIDDEGIDKIFVDGSNLGGFVKAVKRRYPLVEITTFFHNVEARFFLGAFKQNRSFRALAVLVANYLAERKAVKYSDKIICLSNRDSSLLNKVYGRTASYVSPMALQDKLPYHHDRTPNRSTEKYALFVGGIFYANRAGIAWFVEHVVPRINIKICIVGRGFENLIDELEVEGKVEVIGAVDSLSEWYRNAHFAIAPIFDGSGMKTKVAEALMFGKRVIGTPEAFSGYEDALPSAGEICRTSDEFVAAFDRSLDAPFCAMDGQLRALYDRNYSCPAARQRLQRILAA